MNIAFYERDPMKELDNVGEFTEAANTRFTIWFCLCSSLKEAGFHIYIQIPHQKGVIGVREASF